MGEAESGINGIENVFNFLYAAFGALISLTEETNMYRNNTINNKK